MFVMLYLQSPDQVYEISKLKHSVCSRIECVLWSGWLSMTTVRLVRFCFFFPSMNITLPSHFPFCTLVCV